MTVYTFTAAVDSLDLQDTALLTMLYSDEIGVYPSSIDGAVSVEFEVEAKSGEEAVKLAIDHLISAAPHARIVRLDEGLVTATEISERLSVKRETVRLWATGSRRDGFPHARKVLTGGVRLWTWYSVYAWADALGMLPDGEPCPVDDSCIDWYNGRLASQLVYFVFPSKAVPSATRFVNDRQHGIASRWGESVAAHADPDLYPARSGDYWSFDHSGSLKTASKPKYF